jgi:hypothetical protein
MQHELIDSLSARERLTRLADLERLGKIAQNEYFENFIETIVTTKRDAWDDLLENIAREYRIPFWMFLCSYLRTIESNANPNVHLETNTPQNIDITQIAPIHCYVELCNLAEAFKPNQSP